MRLQLKIFLIISFCQQGLPCIVERTQASGTCKLLDKCLPVMQDIKNRIYSHTRCDPFAGNGTEIVCCPERKYTTTAAPFYPGISEKKCHEYKTFILQNTTPRTGPPNKLFVDRCARRTNRLIPSAAVRRREYPYLAMIGYNSNKGGAVWLCSGSLISDEYVLTAAQCAGFGINFGNAKYVRLSDLNFHSGLKPLNEEDYNIAEFMSHPEYKPSSDYNDIALVKLDRKVEFTFSIRPACLPSVFESVEKKAISIGWTRDEPHDVPRFKHEILDQFNTRECNQSFSSHAIQRLKRIVIADSQLCAGVRENKIQIYGPDDLGGPLQLHHPDEYCMQVVIGIRSQRIDSDLSFPEIYTRVFSYLDWIENIVWTK